MPEVPLPEAMGLNENAAISRDTGDSEKLISGVRLTQPISGETSTTKDVTSVSSAMLRHVGELIQVSIHNRFKFLQFQKASPFYQRELLFVLLKWFILNQGTVEAA